MADIDPRLARDCAPLGRFPLCRVLLMRDARYPWFILVPDREGVSEIHELPAEDQQQLIHESSALARTIAAQWRAHKLNVAALGNVVPQLHLHHIVRFRHDPAWPAPVWARGEPLPYEDAELARTVAAACAALADCGVPFTAAGT